MQTKPLSDIKTHPLGISLSLFPHSVLPLLCYLFLSHSLSSRCLSPQFLKETLLSISVHCFSGSLAAAYEESTASKTQRLEPLR